MKTLKTLTAALLVVVSFGAFAADETSSEKLNMNYTLKTYVDAISIGKLNGLAEIIDGDAKLTLTRGQKIINYSKADILQSLKNTQNIEQNCTIENHVIESGITQTIVKVTMRYPGFSRINYVSMANTSKGWKITNISTTFI